MTGARTVEVLRVGRPSGEVRLALLAAAQAINAENSDGGATWRDMAERACVGYRVARRTVSNMVRDDVLEGVGAVKRAHSRRWMRLYAPRREPEGQGHELQALLRQWRAGEMAMT